jgi:hypothetical protein
MEWRCEAATLLFAWGARPITIKPPRGKKKAQLAELLAFFAGKAKPTANTGGINWLKGKIEQAGFGAKWSVLSRDPRDAAVAAASLSAFDALSMAIRWGSYDMFSALTHITPLQSLRESEQGLLLGHSLAFHAGTWGAERIAAKLERDLLPGGRAARAPKLTALLGAVLGDEKLPAYPPTKIKSRYAPRVAGAFWALAEEAGGVDPLGRRPEGRASLFEESGSGILLMGLSER